MAGALIMPIESRGGDSMGPRELAWTFSSNRHGTCSGGIGPSRALQGGRYGIDPHMHAKADRICHRRI